MATIADSIEVADYRRIADAINEEYTARKKRREHLEKQWAEIDRQLRMEPDISHKMGLNIRSGRLVKDPKRNWMPEIELPLQAGSLETLLSDVRRMRYPSNSDWFTVRAALTEQYFEKFVQAGSPFMGEKGENFDGEIKQDDADKLVQGFISHWHSLYDFRGHMDLIDAQALTYGFGVGRMRRVKGRHLGYNAIRQAKDLETPVLVPRNSKNVYLDDSQHALMHAGFALGPAILQDQGVNLADLQAAAKNDDTYIGSEVNRLKKDKHGNVTLVELEGDFAFDRGSETIILQDVELTIALDGKAACLVRVKDGEKFSTYIVNQYHLEGAQFVYASSPLLKGMPIAKVAAQALNRVIESGLLRTQPPISYSPDDPNFAAEGGPDVHPKALWQTVDGVKVETEVGGDTGALFSIFERLVQMYEDVATGVTPARRGAQTKSHTTAFAKNIEAQRGVVRTVDYVRSTLEGQMTRFLNMEYRMGLDVMKGAETVYIQEWNEFVSLKKGHLPDTVKFLAIGSDAPAEEQARISERLAGGQAAFQLDASARQLGLEPAIQDVRPMVEQILRDTGWQNVDELFTAMQGEAPEGAVPQGQPGLTREVPRLLE